MARIAELLTAQQWSAVVLYLLAVIVAMAVFAALGWAAARSEGRDAEAVGGDRQGTAAGLVRTGPTSMAARDRHRARVAALSDMRRGDRGVGRRAGFSTSAVKGFARDRVIGRDQYVHERRAAVAERQQRPNTWLLDEIADGNAAEPARQRREGVGVFSPMWGE